MNIEISSGMKAQLNSMDFPVFENNEYVQYLSELVSYTKAKIPFYSRLYNTQSGVVGSVGEFETIPVVNEGMLIRERLEDMIADWNLIHEVCYPAGKLVSECCMPRVQSQEDQEDQYLILEWILEECLSLEIKKDKPSICMIADEDNSYSTGAFCKMMILLLNSPFYGLIIRGHSKTELYNEISHANPDILITSVPLDRDVIPTTVHTVIGTAEQAYDSRWHADVRFCHVLTHPLLGLVGISVNDAGRYLYNPDYYYIENSVDGMIMYTSFMQKLMPIVRLRSRHWGRVIRPGSLEITYKGTH